MHSELAPTVIVPAIAIPVRSRSDAEAIDRSQPLSWRLAVPLIGAASFGLWILCAKAAMLVARHL